MKDYTLSKERIAELEKFHRSLRDKRQADRVKASQFMVGGSAAPATMAARMMAGQERRVSIVLPPKKIVYFFR